MIFTTLENISNENIDLNGFALYEDVSGASIQMNEKEIQSGEVKVFANDVELFKNLTGRTNLDVIPFMLEMTFKNDVKLCMLDGNGACVDSLYTVIDDKHLIDHGSYIVEKKGDSLEINHIKVDTLKELEFKIDSVEIAGASFLSRFSGSVLCVVVILILSGIFFFILKKKRAKTKIPAEAGIPNDTSEKD